MAVELDRYLGREQSYIKHLFLTQYLQAAGYKTLQGRSRTFNFVDAFAGPWHVSDDANYSDASFDQALRTLEAVRANLGRSGVAGLKIRFCFCERRTRSVEELRRYAEQKGNFEIHIFHGSFEDHLDRIASVCRDGFTRLLHKSWHVIVTRTPTFRVANASQNSPCSIRPCHDCRPIASVAYPHQR